MAGEATAIVTFAHRAVFEELHGPAGSRMWRPGYVACLIEKHLPVWVITPFGFAAGEEADHIVVVSHGLSGRPAIADLVPVMAGLFGDSDALLALAEREGLLRHKGRASWVEPYIEPPAARTDEEEDEYETWEATPISAALFEETVRIVSEKCRASVVAFPGSIIAEEGSVVWLRGMGVDVDEFKLAAAGEP